MFTKLPLLALILCVVPPVSRATTFNFAEFGTSPSIDVNGLYTQGVLFEFTPAGAIYNGMIGTSGTAVLSIDPVLSGPATGTLTLTFDDPTPILEFDIVLQSLFPIDDSAMGDFGGPAYTVTLSSGDILSGSTAPQSGGIYSEGEFLYTGQPVKTASITFFNGLDAGGMPVQAFGIDNLTFTGAPEPATYLLIAAGLIGVASLKRWPRRRP